MQVSLRGITKDFDGASALAGVDLDVGSGSTLAVLGESGCGKSTLLRALLGLVLPDGGSLLVDGQPWPLSQAARLRSRTGYVIQDGGLFPHLTARANVTLMANHLGWSQSDIAARVSELAALVRLSEAPLDRYPAQLSGGQRQRVGLMRALMLKPELLLLDEPLASLDPITRAELQADLRTIFRRLGNAVLLVTHDLGEAAFLCDHMMLMHAGRCLQYGTMADLIERPQDPYVTRFVQAQRAFVAPQASPSKLEPA